MEWEHEHRTLMEKIDDLGLGWVMLIAGIGVPLAITLILGTVLFVIALITGTTDQWKW